MKKIIVLSLIGLTTFGACVAGFVLSMETQVPVTQVLLAEAMRHDGEYYESYSYAPIDSVDDDY